MAEDNQKTSTAKVRYSSSKGSIRGKLTRTSTPITVDSTSYHRNHNPESIDYPVEISHKYYLDCKIIDKKAGNLLHETHTITFSAYMRQNGPVVVSYRAPTSDNSQIITYDYVPPPYRKKMKCMIKFIQYLHSKNKSLAGFSMKRNLLVSNNILKFWRVVFIDATPQTKEDDFKFLHTEIQNVLFMDLVIPQDIQKLLQMMISSTRDDELLVNHLSIMSSAKRIDFFKGARDKKDCLYGSVEKKKYDLIVKFMDIQNWDNFSNPMIYFGPVIHCMTRRGSANYTVDGEGLLKCCRDLTLHVQEFLKKAELDIDVMVSSVFLPQLMDFQELLHGSEILQHFISL